MYCHATKPVLGKVPVPQLSKEFPAHHGTQRFTTVFTTAVTSPYPESN